MSEEVGLSARWARRILVVGLYAVAWTILVGALPLLLPGALLFDAAGGRRGAATRMLGFALGYLSFELLGLAGALGVWVPYGLGLVSRPRFETWNFRLQCRWARVLFGTARRLYRVRLEVLGQDRVLPGPLLVLARHASLIDTLLPAAVLSAPLGLRLRYVLKSELLWDPCLDVVGHRLPNAFVRRDGVQSGPEIESVRGLTRDLGESDGVLIFPEGTRFTPTKRERAIGRLQASRRPELAARARELRHVLPPRLGGILALLDAAPRADVLLFAHRGLEGLTRPRHFWSGKLLDRTVEVVLWRIPAEAIPTEEDERIDWLYAQWARLDAWVGARPNARRGSGA